MQIYKIDENGYFIEDVILKKGEEIPSDCVEVRPPQPCYNPRWNGEEWIEEGEPPEPQPKEPTEKERLEALEQAMLEMIMGGM